MNGGEAMAADEQSRRRQGQAVTAPVIEARNEAALSQHHLAPLVGVSVRTPQGWEPRILAARHGGANAARPCKYQSRIHGGSRREASIVPYPCVHCPLEERTPAC